MADSKRIWLPKSTLNVTVQDGNIHISETMVMEEKPVQPAQGFQPKERSAA